MSMTSMGFLFIGWMLLFLLLLLLLNDCHAWISSSSIHNSVINGWNCRRAALSPLILSSSSSSSLVDEEEDGSMSMSRRTALQQFSLLVSSSSLVWMNHPKESHAAAAAAVVEEEMVVGRRKSSLVTHVVTLNVRVSRADGTFYVRDVEEPDGAAPLYTTLELELWGEEAPHHVEQFLKYCQPGFIQDELGGGGDDDTTVPMPSYGRSNFVSLNQQDGLLIGGSIPGLQLTTQFQSTPSLEYKQKRLLPAPLWIEDTNTSSNNNKGGLLHQHNQKGLLTHKDLDPTPTFGITTRSAQPELDATHTIFGQLKLTDEANSFLNFIQDIPTYSMDRSRGMTDPVSSSVYSFQKDLFRGAAKSLGDTRLSNVYEGKLLRRVEVTNIQLTTTTKKI